MFATPQLEQGKSAAARRSGPPEDLSKQFGGLVILEYLMHLFEDSPKELFGRVDVLALLDAVKNDKAFFPEAVVAVSDRIDAAAGTQRWTSPKSARFRSVSFKTASNPRCPI